MNYYLGVDGGGTKTKFIICDAFGRLQAQSIQPTCHYLQCGLDGVTKVMQDGMYDCLNSSAIKVEQIAAAFIACAGYRDIEKDSPAIERAVKKAYPQIPHMLGNDMENALAGSLAGAAGSNVNAGTGSIGLGKNEQGQMCRSAGWHHIFGGDEGSAYWIACRLIQHFTKQSDGREPKTALYEAVKTQYHLQEDSDILTTCVVNWNFDRTRVAAMSQTVFTLAKQNDPVAMKIFQEAAKELADIYLAIYRQLPFTSKNIPVSYSGGVFKSGSYILEPLKEYLSIEPTLTLTAPILSPDAGSIILAMQYDNRLIDEKIIQNLRTL